MPRRTIALVGVFLGALVVANIAVLAIWLPRHNSTAANSSATKSSAPAGSAPSASVTASGQASSGTSGLSLERQVPSASGNLRIKYLRDRETKMRAVAVENAHQPGGGSLLYKTKQSVWALVSPDDRWILVQERSPKGTGGMQLYQRANESSLQFAPVQGSADANLQDTVWKAYLAATQDNPDTSPEGATIDATGWEADSRKLDLTLVYMPTKSRPEVPPPWACTYDVVSKQVEPVSIPATAEDGGETADAEPAQAAHQVASNSSVPADAADAPAEAPAEEELPGERFPATRLDELSVPDVNESSLSDIVYAINEMYARHGVDFKDKKVAKQFSEFSWYTPSPGKGFDEAEQDFSDVEKQNVQVLKRCRDAKVVATQRKSRPRERTEEESTGQKIMRGIRAWQDAGGPLPPHP